MSTVTILRTLRAALADLPANANSRPKVEAVIGDLSEANRRRTDYAARGQLAWATRQRNARKGKRAAK